MKIVKPSWVDNEGCPIFSVDIHPDGSRFATGGQGGDAGRVTIWNMGPVVSQEQENNESIPKLLCQMDNHLACVNVVRWSHSGKYLASAGDDKVIMIWQISAYSVPTPSFGGGVNVEQWRCLNTLRSHSGDILDLNWSPDDKWIASCSVDTTVIVWNTSKFPEATVVLKGHNGFVKGVSWDPIGKYLVSQSDDKSLKIWRTSDWKLETSITEPFKEAGPTTHVLRSHWSPDGQFLVSAHAMNNCGPTAQIIEREGWVTKRDFVGHRKAVTCVRFNPNILTKTKKDKKTNHSCIAFGSRDRSVSIWCTTNERPLVVLRELFKESVLDLSWSKDGYSLLCCSKDGTVAHIEFEEFEIGTPLTSEEKTSHLQKLYRSNLESARDNLLVEDPEILKIREEQQKRQQEQNKLKQNLIQVQQQCLHNGSNESCSKSNAGDSRSSLKLNKGPTDKQIETRMPDGRRRITPLYIPPPTDCDGAPIPFSSQQTTFSSSSEAKTKIVIEKRNDVSSNISQSSLQISSQNASQPSSQINTSVIDQTTHASPKPSSQNKSHSDQDSVPVQTSQPSSQEQNQSQFNKLTKLESDVNKTSSLNHNNLKRVKNKNDNHPVKMMKTMDSIPIKSVNGKVSSFVKKKPSNKTPIDKRKSVNINTSSTLTKTATSTNKSTNSCMSTNINEEKSSTKIDTKGYFPPLKISLCSSVNITFKNESGPKTLTAEVENSVNSSSLSALRLMNDDIKQWEVLLSSTITGLTGCEDLIGVACDDATISVFSTPTGRRLQPPILLPSSPSKLTCLKSYLMVVTTTAAVWVWNFNSHSVLVKNESLLPLFHISSEISLTNIGLTDGGFPIVSLSTGRSYVFDIAFSSWSLISNTQDLLNYCSDYKPNWSSELEAHPLAILQSQHRFMKKTHNLFLTNSNLQRSGTLSFIDQQLASSFVIGSSKEYRYWLITLAQYLTEEGMETRLRELCQYLLGPPFRSSKSKWENVIVGNEKHELLKEVLAITTNNLKLQRIYNEFKQQLDLT